MDNPRRVGRTPVASRGNGALVGGKGGADRNPRDVAMPRPSQFVRTLFPVETRPASRHRSNRASSGLSQLVAVTCALVPLGAVVHAMVLTA